MALTSWKTRERVRSPFRPIHPPGWGCLSLPPSPEVASFPIKKRLPPPSAPRGHLRPSHQCSLSHTVPLGPSPRVTQQRAQHCHSPCWWLRPFLVASRAQLLPGCWSEKPLSGGTRPVGEAGTLKKSTPVSRKPTPHLKADTRAAKCGAWLPRRRAGFPTPALSTKSNMALKSPPHRAFSDYVAFRKTSFPRSVSTSPTIQNWGEGGGAGGGDTHVCFHLKLSKLAFSN